MTVQPPPPPGWYPDSQVPGRLRFWDGVRWTQHTAPVPAGGWGAPVRPATTPRPYQHQVPARPAFTPRTPVPQNWFLRHAVLSVTLGVVALLVLVGVIGSVVGEAADPPPSSEANRSTVSGGDDAAEEDAAVETEAEPVDTDGDGVLDPDDYAPRDPKVKTRDDVDTDGDGVADYRDDFPKDAEFTTDSDGDDVADRLDAFPNDERYSKDSDGDDVADSVDAFPWDDSRWKITLAMENALSSAEDYLDFTAFSRQGLIDQLSSEYGSGYEVADATWAVSQLKVDWKEQAVQSAKDYLDLQAFSRQGLIDQLSSPYGSQYTLEEATYAVNKIGL